jgi:glycosyltransferase involved in cell wall biosynthesis
MSVALITINDPSSVIHGGTARTRAFLRAFVNTGSDVYCLHPAGSVGQFGVEGVRYVDFARDALGGRRWPGWIRSLKRSILPMPTATGARSAAVIAELRRIRPQVVVVSHLSLAPLASVSGGQLWLDHSDLWSAFLRREAGARKGPFRITAMAQARQLASSEDRFSRDALVCTAAGWTDAKEVSSRCGRNVAWLPTPVSSGRVPLRDGAERRAGFIANFGFYPNLDALQILLTRWLPLLKDAGWTLTVAGLGSDRLDLPPSVLNLGVVATVEEFYAQVAVTLAPVRLGGGIKVKVAESLAYGTPVIASAFAMEGYPPQLRRMVRTVDLYNPDLSFLGSKSAPILLDSTPEALARFTALSFSDQVADLLHHGSQ